MVSQSANGLGSGSGIVDLTSRLPVAGAYVRLGAHSGLKSDIARGPKSATFGPSDHLVGMRGKCRASSVSAGRGAGGVPRHPLPVACAHHRVERADRGPRHVSRTTLPGSPQRLPRPGIGTPYGVTHTHFAIVPRSALGSKFLMILRDKNSPRVRECLEFYF